MGTSTADLHYFLVQNIESIESYRQVGLFEVRVTQLAVLVVAPGVDFILGHSIVISRRPSANDRREFKSAGDLCNCKAFEGFNKDRGAHAVVFTVLSLVLLAEKWDSLWHSELAHSIRAHSVQMAV